MLTTLLTTLQGCSTASQQISVAATPSIAADTATGAQHNKASATEKKPFSAQTLYDLLLGETAAQQQQFPLASEKYLAAAQHSDNAAIAARAAQLALYSNNYSRALAAAAQWYSLAPESSRAATLYANLLAQTGDGATALTVLEAQLARRQTADFSLLRHRSLTTAAQRQMLLPRLDVLHRKYRDRRDISAATYTALTLSYASLLQHNGEQQRALDTLQTANKITGRAETIPPSTTIDLTLLESHLLQQLEQPKAALRTVKKRLQQYPDNRPLQLRLARLLTRSDLPAAEKLFGQLLQATPHDADLLLSHALIAKQNAQLALAKKQFNTLLSLGKHRAISHYSLGSIARQQQDDDLAAEHLSRVPPGQYLLPAAQQLIDIFFAHQQFDAARQYLDELHRVEPLQAPKFWLLEVEALQRIGLHETAHNTLDQAIKQFPEQLLLRLKRALSSEQRQDIAGAEHDLRFILARSPNNAGALNALGYTLSNHSQRYDEALDLIRRAHRLQPDNPAIVDSLGWAHYRLGNLQEAITHLERAFAQLPDDEVAAHLLEAYWADGKKSRARRLLRKMKRHHTELPEVRAAATRLGIPF